VEKATSSQQRAKTLRVEGAGFMMNVVPMEVRGMARVVISAEGEIGAGQGSKAL
jgi:hypothetical protein